MKLQKLPKTAIIALTITGLFLTLTTVAAAQDQSNRSLKKTITAVNLGVYSDNACTKTATALNFGTINPGGTDTQTIYVKTPATFRKH